MIEIYIYKWGLLLFSDYNIYLTYTLSTKSINWNPYLYLMLGAKIAQVWRGLYMSLRNLIKPGHVTSKHQTNK